MLPREKHPPKTKSQNLGITWIQQTKPNLSYILYIQKKGRAISPYIPFLLALNATYRKCNISSLKTLAVWGWDILTILRKYDAAAAVPVLLMTLLRMFNKLAVSISPYLCVPLSLSLTLTQYWILSPTYVCHQLKCRLKYEFMERRNAQKSYYTHYGNVPSKTPKMEILLLLPTVSLTWNGFKLETKQYPLHKLDVDFSLTTNFCESLVTCVQEFWNYTWISLFWVPFMVV